MSSIGSMRRRKTVWPAGAPLISQGGSWRSFRVRAVDCVRRQSLPETREESSPECVGRLGLGAAMLFVPRGTKGLGQQRASPCLAGQPRELRTAAVASGINPRAFLRQCRRRQFVALSPEPHDAALPAGQQRKGQTCARSSRMNDKQRSRETTGSGQHWPLKNGPRLPRRSSPRRLRGPRLPWNPARSLHRAATF